MATEIPIKIQFVKSLSTTQPSRIVVVKADEDTAFSLWVTDKTGIPYPLKDLQNNVIITNTDGNLQITSSSTSTNINLASSILATINSALQSGDNVSELVNDSGYLTTFTETDPIFQASEASLFVSGDKANLDNQSGVNSGNQTSIVGISGTKAQFNTELTDGDFLFVGDVLDTPDATVTTKGILKLTGDLGGTADNPTTPTAIHKIGDEVKQGILTLSDGLKIVGNTTSTTATKVNVQENDGTINTISKSDLVNVIEADSAAGLPITGVAGKLYITKDNNKIYTWNGTFYSEFVGAKGDKGDQGIQGLQGVAGLTGLKGDKGDIGLTGVAGTNGLDGAKGDQGIQGIQGFKGDIGLTGADGAMGVQGPQGIQGIQGETGLRGIQGETGPQGPIGFTGEKGADGNGVSIKGSFDNTSQLPASGADGDAYLISGNLHVWNGTAWVNVGNIQGPQGLIGLTGATGNTGPQGVKGEKGDQGIQGIQGLKGDTGAKGDTGSFNGDITADQVTETATRKFQTPTQSAYNDATSSIQGQLNSKENSFTKNTAFNKNFGTTVGTVVEGGTLGSNAYTSTAYLPLSGGTVNGSVYFNSTTGGAISFQTNSLPLALMTSSQNIIGGAGSTTDFNTYVYGNNPYNIWTDGVKRLEISGLGVIKINDLSGTGTRNVVADASGNLLTDSTVYAPLNGTGANGTWGINISGNSQTSSALGSYNWNPTVKDNADFMFGRNSANEIAIISQLGVRNFLGLGSNAYSSTAYLPLTGGTINANNETINYKVSSNNGALYNSWYDFNNNRISYLGFGGGTQSNATFFVASENGGNIALTTTGVGKVVVPSLSGTGTRAVVADASGILSTDSTVYAPLASPLLTGTPTAPTAPAGTNTTQIATTAFVLANAGGVTSTGTTNRIPKFTSSNSLGDSGLIQVGGNIGMGSAVVPGELFHIGDGNILLEGGGEVAQKFKRDFTTTGENLGVPTGSGISVNPIFQVGRIIQAGDGDPEIRIMYSDDNTSERTVFEVDRKGIAASVKTSIGSHFEGFASLTDVNPKFRLNSYPRMRLEMGAGGNDITDVAVERGATGSLDFFTNSAYRGGFDSSGNLNLLNKPTAPTAPAGTNTTQIATTAFVQANYLPLSGGTLSGAISGTSATFSSSVTASGFFQSSDKNLKDIIKRDGDVAYFTWKDGRDDKTHIGYIAQEVRRTNPDQVQKGEDKMLSVNYVEILVEKVQSLEKRVKQLEYGLE